MDDSTRHQRARALAFHLEPLIGQVYFAPEAHERYVGLGFDPSPGVLNNVAMPDGPAYFTSRGSLLGQVAPEVVAAAFGVFKPEVVVAGVQRGWELTDAPTIFAARRDGAVDQLKRVLNGEPDRMRRAADLAEQAAAPLRPEGRPLFAGARDQWDDPDDATTRFFHLGDMLREYRGDAHVNAWTTAGLDACEIGLLMDLYIGLPARSYVRTRAWNDAELDVASERLAGLGWLEDEALTPKGRAEREAIEAATDRQIFAGLDALGDDFDELVATIEPWGAAMRAAGGYVGGPVDLWPNRG